MQRGLVGSEMCIRDSYVALPSMLDDKKMSIGKGKKVEFLESLPTYEMPGPGDYKVNSSSFRGEKGVSFTTDAQPVDNVYTPHSPYVPLKKASKIPGPSEYEVKHPLSPCTLR
eukprot:TRINITY_DN22429_c0_g1_i3.p3 TRINITY_DN22429_c0_g1~~TRINITY_DN22429_c0_g1_i3.p3  ORF type:complete len:113 (+),score=19.19 TRINITY_DN22429_c0_g1_i3:153-491(+)